jgi:hypothetical protein
MSHELIINDFVHLEPSLTLDTTGKWIPVFSALGIKVIIFLAISLTYEFDSLCILRKFAEVLRVMSDCGIDLPVSFLGIS